MVSETKVMGEGAASASFPKGEPSGRLAVAALAGLLGAVGLASYLGFEVKAAGATVALVVLASVLFRPALGVVIFIASFALATYPEPLRGVGALTVNNLLGLLLGTVLLVRVAQHLRFPFLRSPQVQLLFAIGAIFFLSHWRSQWLFPDLRVTTGPFGYNPLDVTAEMAEQFVTRLAFLIFIVSFLHSRREILAAVFALLFCWWLAVPSALVNYLGGHAHAGYRAVADITIGTNPNRLALVCLLAASLLWFYLNAKPRWYKTAICSAMILGAVVTVFLTASRSGFLGLLLVAGVLIFERRGERRGTLRLAAFVAAGAIAFYLVVPEVVLQRITNLWPTQGERTEQSVEGTGSFVRRLDTVTIGVRVARDYPLTGVGLGNFREVVRQIYHDLYYRPPHDSFIWAATEGGVACLVLYLWLFWVTWRQVNFACRYARADMRWVARGLRMNFLLLMFFSLFADLWLNPVTYTVVGLTIVVARYVRRERVREAILIWPGLPKPEKQALAA